MTRVTRSSPTVSVIIPTRDRPSLVEAALASVQAQTRPVDDGSAPDNARALAELARRRPEVAFLRLDTPGGPSAARNLGLAHARGSHLLFLDDDDLIHPLLCADGLAALAGRADADAVVFLYECFFEPPDFRDALPVALLFDYRRLAQHPVQAAGHTNRVPAALLADRPVSAFLRFLIPIHSCLVSRKAVGDHRFPEALRQGEDTYFWISLAADGCRFAADPRVYAYVRRHAGNTTRSRSQYVRGIRACYEALLADRLLSERRDRFLAHLKLLWFGLSMGRGWLSHLDPVLAAPDLLAREIVFWTGNLRSRRRLLDYYFLK
jgi:glycosyltransferase involved in cell wall biosynthesis